MPKKPMIVPEALPHPIVDNHTHLESVVATMLATPDFLESQCAEPAKSTDVSRETTSYASEAADANKLHPDESSALARVLANAFDAGVDRLVQVGCDLPSAQWTAILLKELNPLESLSTGELAKVLGAVAIHPNEAVLHAGIREIAKDGLEPRSQPHHEIPLDTAIGQIADIAAQNPRIRAIGETGMDTFRAGPKGVAAQRESFRAHIALAKELDLALQIHDREAHNQVIEILLKDGAPEKTVFHCFSGDEVMAKFCAQQGWYLSFAGPVTYKSNAYLRDALAVTPLHLLLVETDAPYLTPHPYRGQPNAPFAVNYTLRAISEYLNLPISQLCKAVSKNSETVYGTWG